ncbi:unnamed protein product [Auanema sp. JU1783]|nr:unnamed protein product [Auanema sp. JU1783]
MDSVNSQYEMAEEGPVEEFVLPESKPSIATIEDMVTPVSPTKKISARLTEETEPPESPDMKFARNRLGTLLTSIRKGDAPSLATNTEQKREEIDRRGPGRPRKLPTSTTKSKTGEVIFELRGKSFVLKEGQESTEYQLVRSWMRGKPAEEDSPVVIPECDPTVSMDLLATKDVVALPRADSPYLVDTEYPNRDSLDQLNTHINAEDIDGLRNEYARHWRSVKKSWLDHQRRRKARYHKTIGLLETIFTIAQQSHT